VVEKRANTVSVVIGVSFLLCLQSKTTSDIQVLGWSIFCDF
jgi:hypothetical protein